LFPVSIEVVHGIVIGVSVEIDTAPAKNERVFIRPATDGGIIVALAETDELRILIVEAAGGRRRVCT